ncbi:MAG: HEAT repeat domain-containing protein [Sandaracinaceae bacterium]|nr:HEAT repeat domain-containing protein [Sandaracinaceae bacterium]
MNNQKEFPLSDEGDERLSRAVEAVAGLDDDAALRKIRRRTSWFGRILAILFVGGGALLAFFAWERHVAYEQRWDEYQKARREAQNVEDFLQRIRAIYPKSTFQDVRIQILAKFGEYKDVQALPLIIQALDEPGPVRTQAARSIAQIGSPGADSARPALLRVLAESKDPANRAAVAWALAVLGESSAADAIVEEFAAGRLQGQPGFDPRVVARAVGVERLSKMTKHKEVSVRALVAQALSEAGGPEVVSPLIELLSDEDDQVRKQAAAGLGRVGDTRAASALFAAMQRNPSMRLQVLDALKRSTSAKGLALLLREASSDEARRDLVAMIRATHDPEGAEALASMLSSKDEQIRFQASAGLAELGDKRAQPFLLEFAKGSDLDRARDALDLLFWVSSPEVVPALAPMLNDDAFIARRAGIIKVLGRSGSEEAGRLLMREIDGDDAGAAAIALAELRYEPAFQHFLRAAPRPKNTPFNQHAGMCGALLEPAFKKRTAAVRGLGHFGRPQAAPVLMAIIEDTQDDLRLRSEAGLALGAVADEAILAKVIEKVRAPQGDEAAKRFYLAALWQRPSKALSSKLFEIVADSSLSADLRLPAAVALGYAADPAYEERLVELLRQPRVADGAALAIALGGSEAGAKALLQALSQDTELRTVIQDLFLKPTNDWLSLVTRTLWDSGQIHRRLIVADILHRGEGENRYGFAWTAFIARLQAGWNGIEGMNPIEIRKRLYQDLRSENTALRPLIARTLAAMGEIGLLLAARDAGGPGSEEARALLMEMNRPRSDEEAQRALGGIVAR